MPKATKSEEAEPTSDERTFAPPDEGDEVEHPEGETEKASDDGEKKAEEDPRDREMKQLRRELRRTGSRIRELEESERHWAEVARAGRGAEAEPTEKAAPAEQPEIDVIDAITNEGVKGFEKVLKQLGYVKEADVQDRIERTRGQITQDARLLSKFPDLADEDSEFFAATAKRYEGLKKNNGIRESGMLMELAAELAEKDLARRGDARTGKNRRREEPEPDDEDPDRGGVEDEDERVERVRAQAGTRGQRPTRESAASEELSPLQRRIAKKFEISEDAYRKRAKAGVRMSGLPRR
jgi:hypothetical protein